MEENFSMDWKILGMEWKWKKIASMEYGKIVFHSIPCSARKTVAVDLINLRYSYIKTLHII